MWMRESIILGIESLKSHKLRTALTMLGIVIGVSSVILLTSLGYGAQRYIFSEFQSLGTNLIIIQPGKNSRKDAFGPPIGTASRKMTIGDVRAIEKRAFSVKAVSGVVLGSALTQHGNAESNVTVLGVNHYFPSILSLPLYEGSFFGRDEDDYGRKVVVLGAQVRRTLFDKEHALGKNVKINERGYRVIATLIPMGNKLGFDIDETVFIPTLSALRLFNEDRLLGIRAKASSRSTVEESVSQIKDILKERRDGKEDFTIITQKSMMETMGSILSMLTYVLAGISGISLLVGGIGIMNIMIVTVAERTREIGIRRAVGARRKDILQQFLSEATLLSGLGGGIGIGVALVVTSTLSWKYPSFDLTPPLWVLVTASLLSISVGLLFGVLPAYKASKIQTLDALRHD
jgi:putative ABC transport system permease protein